MPAAGEIGSEEPTRLVEPEAAGPAASPSLPRRRWARPSTFRPTRQRRRSPPRRASPRRQAEPPAEDEPPAEALDDLFSADEEAPAPGTPEPEPEARPPEPEESESLAELMAEEDEAPAGGAIEVPPPPPTRRGGRPPGGRCPRARSSSRSSPEPWSPRARARGRALGRAAGAGGIIGPRAASAASRARARDRAAGTGPRARPSSDGGAPGPGAGLARLPRGRAASRPAGATVEPELRRVGRCRPRRRRTRLPAAGSSTSRPTRGSCRSPAGESDDFEELGPPSEEAPYGREEEDLTGRARAGASRTRTRTCSPRSPELRRGGGLGGGGPLVREGPAAGLRLRGRALARRRRPALRCSRARGDASTTRSIPTR